MKPIINPSLFSLGACLKNLRRSLSVAALFALALFLPTGAHAQFYEWQGSAGAGSNDPANSANWNGTPPTFGGSVTGSLLTGPGSSDMIYSSAQGTTTFSGGSLNGLTWAGWSAITGYGGTAGQTTIQVTGGILSLNGNFSNDGGTESVWLGNGGGTAYLTLSGGTVNVANSMIIGRDSATGYLTIGNASFNTGIFSSSYGTMVGGLSGGTGLGNGVLTIQNGGQFTLSGASADPFLFHGSLIASAANTSSSYLNFAAGSTGHITMNLSSATLGATYYTNLIVHGYVENGGAVDTNLSDYIINTTNLSAATLSLKPVFVHPGISHSQADLDRMKNNINVEPYHTAYVNFTNMGYSSYLNTGQGPFSYETYGHGQFEIRNDAQVCHQNAIMWYVTGNTNYMTNAIALMMAWANTLTNFDQTDYLTAGTCVQDFCDAGEIIRATGNGLWSGSDITTFQNWMLTYLYPPMLSPGGTIQSNVLQAAGAGGLQMAGLISLGIFCDRSDIYNFGVSSLQHNGNFSYGLTEYIDVNSAQNYETQRDTGHASGNLGTMLESFYKAYNQGQDLFSLSNNLLARAFEIQAKFDLGWDLAPAVWTAKDGTFHCKVSSENRFPPGDNLDSDLAYNIYHDIKGLNMPYTKMSSKSKFPGDTSGGGSFYHLVDSSGKVPVPPLIGEPAVTGVRIYEDYLAGSYPLTSFQLGNYNYAALLAGGMKTNYSGAVSSMRVPTGWTVQLYNGDNFTGSSIMVTGTVANADIINLTATNYNFNDQLVSMKVMSGGTYVVFNGTYQLLNRNSGKAAEVKGSSTADGALVDQWAYDSGVNKLWRVEALSGGAYKFSNLNSDKVMEVAGASLSNGANVDQLAYANGNLATNGTATANPDSSGSGEHPAQAFDGNTATKWYNNVLGGVGYLQYQLSTAKAVNQYQIVSASDVQQRDPAAWQFQGSTNGSTWVTLNTQSGQVFASRLQANTYTFTNTTAYLYYRLNITANYGGSSYGIQLSELGLYNTKATLNQQWNISAASGSAYGAYFKLLNVNSGKALDVTGASQYNGTNIIQRPDSGALNQQWMLQNP